MEKFRKPGRTRIAAVVAAVLAAAAFASLAATGYAARIVAFAHTSPVAAQYPPSKVTICHHTHSAKNPFVTITVSTHALPAHLRHGDTIGPCAQQAAPVAAAKQHKPHKVHTKHAPKQHKQHKQHPAKPNSNKTQHGHGKTAKVKKIHTKGKSAVAHVHVQAPVVKSAVHGKSHAATHGQAKGHQKVHVKTHGQSGQHGHGNGQGGGHGHGQGGGGTPVTPVTPSNSGGGNGKGNGHKP